MRKIIAILCVCLLLTGCGTSYDDAGDISKMTGGGYFTLIKEWGGGYDEGRYSIMYANDTRVMYLIWNYGYKGGITPLYNADGTLQIYKKEEKDGE